MALCQVTSKVFLSLIILIFWAAAAALMFVGIWVFKEYQHFDEILQAHFTLLPAIIIIGAGVFLLVLGLLGCVGAYKENRCLLATFFTLLLIVLCAEVAAGILAYVYREKVDGFVKNGIKNAIKKYANDSVLRHQVDFMQSELHCCGLHNYSEWSGTTWHILNPNKTTPDSCCKHQKCEMFENQTTIYQEGCYQKMKTGLLHNLGIVAGVAVGFALIQFLGLVFTCILFCRKQPSNPYIGLDETGGYPRGYRA